jgi:hypothetical protein
MRLCALVEAGDPEAIDVYLAEEDAQCTLEDRLRDEPDCHNSKMCRVQSPTRAAAGRAPSLQAIPGCGPGRGTYGLRRDRRHPRGRRARPRIPGPA